MGSQTGCTPKYTMRRKGHEHGFVIDASLVMPIHRRGSTTVWPKRSVHVKPLIGGMCYVYARAPTAEEVRETQRTVLLSCGPTQTQTSAASKAIARILACHDCRGKGNDTMYEVDASRGIVGNVPLTSEARAAVVACSSGANSGLAEARSLPADHPAFPGMGAFAAVESIPKGTLISSFHGMLMLSREASSMKKNAHLRLYDIDIPMRVDHLQRKKSIRLVLAANPAAAGSIAATVNDPMGTGEKANCEWRVYVEQGDDGARVHVCLVGQADIRRGEELTLAYGASQYWDNLHPRTHARLAKLRKVADATIDAAATALGYPSRSQRGDKGERNMSRSMNRNKNRNRSASGKFYDARRAKKVKGDPSMLRVWWRGFSRSTLEPLDWILKFISASSLDEIMS